MCLVSSGESEATLLLCQTGRHPSPIPGHLEHQQLIILSTMIPVYYTSST